MAARGFKETYGTFHKPFNEETTLWVSLQILADRLKQGKLGVLPRVGFINWRVAEFFTRYLDDPSKEASHVAPTLSATLGYLIPGELNTEIFFNVEPEPLRQSAAQVISSTMTHGMPFMTRYPNLPELGRWAADPRIEPEAMHYQPFLLRAVIYYLLGDWARCAEFVNRKIQEAQAAGIYAADPGLAAWTRVRDLISKQSGRSQA
jgi:hypothetical protein